MSEAPTLAQQADAVTLAALNQRGHCSNLENLVRRNKRPATDLEIARLALPALEAAAATLTALAKRGKP